MDNYRSGDRRRPPSSNRRDYYGRNPPASNNRDDYGCGPYSFIRRDDYGRGPYPQDRRNSYRRNPPPEHRRDDYGPYHPHTRAPSPLGMRIRGAAHARKDSDHRSYDLGQLESIQDPRGDSDVPRDDHQNHRQGRDDDFRDDSRNGYGNDYANGHRDNYRDCYRDEHHSDYRGEYFDEFGYGVGPRERITDYENGRNTAQQGYRGGLKISKPDRHSTGLENRNHGDKDVGDSPMTLLLVRGLAQHTTEQSLADAFSALSETQGHSDGPHVGSFRRIVLIRVREPPQESAGFGFVEYHSVMDSKAAKHKITAMGGGFQVDSISPKVDYPHVGVFPRANIGSTEYNGKYLINMPQSSFLNKYHDSRYFASALVVKATAPSLPADSSKPAQHTAAVGFTANDNALEDLKPKTKKRKERPSGFEMPAQWKRSTAELRGEDFEREKDQNDKKPASGVNAIPNTIQRTYSDDQTFAHVSPERIACYLCNAEFVEEVNLSIHLINSEKHAKNLKDKDAVNKAYRRLEVKKIDPQSTIRPPVAPDGSRAAGMDDLAPGKYRDRAAERRQNEAEAMGGQPTKVGFSLKVKAGASSDTPSSAKPSAPSDATAQYGKGAAMLQRSGYVAGQGLGASGEGISAHIEQNLYAAGVGLGHEGSKRGDAVEEAHRRTKADDYAESAKDGARRRFGKM